MKAFLKAASLTVSVVALLSAGSAAFAADTSSSAPAAVDGAWDGVLSRNGVDVPFRFDIKGSGANLQGVFYDGFTPYDGTTSASFKDGKLQLNIEHYLTTIDAKLDNGALTGTAVSQGRDAGAQYSFHAARHVEVTADASQAPNIAGKYVIPLSVPSSKGEKAFNFIVEQRGSQVAASILRIDGDTGAYSGDFKDGKWVLSHFDGGRPGVIVVTPKADGTLDVRQADKAAAPAEKTADAGYNADPYAASATPDGRYAATLTAVKQDVAVAKGLPVPDDFLTHTTAQNPDDVFKFNFKDVNGKLVSNDDARFKNKVVLAIVTGTWCPNCHDEAQYLVKLDKKYRDKGLAIVALDFEEPEQQATLAREKAFIKQYGVKYTYLNPGAPAEMWEKVPQLAHLDSWPTTAFIGRDGKVKAVHSGFASPASGTFHTELEQEFTSRVEQLLAEKAPTLHASTETAPRQLARAN